jgi:hypothetical protein
MMSAKMYAVPATVAEALRLTAIRRKDAEGWYLLSGVDLQGYGTERAKAEGAVALTQGEARRRFAL